MSKHRTKKKLDFEPTEAKKASNKRGTRARELRNKITPLSLISLVIFIVISFSLNIYLVMRDCDNDVMEQLEQCSESLAMSQEQLDICSTNLQTSNQQIVQCLLNCTLELGNE